MEDTILANDPETGERIGDIVPLRPSDVSYEIELDDAPDSGQLALVDVPAPIVELRPVIPAHLRTLPGLRSAVARQAGRNWHRARYHGIRSPKYLFTALAWAVVGVLRVIGSQLR